MNFYEKHADNIYYRGFDYLISFCLDGSLYDSFVTGSSCSSYCLYFRENVHFIVIYLLAKSHPDVIKVLPLAAPSLETL
jgi:hypothetical protein